MKEVKVMHRKITLFATLVVALLIVCFQIASRGTFVSSTTTEETPTQVVKRYVSSARAGKFDELKRLTAARVSSDERITKIRMESEREIVESGRPGDKIVVPDETVASDAILDWVQGDVARSIFDERLVIKTVEAESIKDDQAKVEVVLGKERQTGAMGWHFLLILVEDNWKIYDITTPALSY